MNVAEPCRRARYRIDPRDLETFRSRRLVMPQRSRMGRKARNSDVIEFY